MVTGLGLVTPLGHDVGSTWAAILAGQSGIGAIDSFDAARFRSRIGGLIRRFDPGSRLDPQLVRRTSLFVQYGLVAALEALEDAGVELGSAEGERVGVSFGSGVGGLEAIERERDLLRDGGPDQLSPLLVTRTISNIVSGYLSQLTGARGPNLGLVSACASGAHSLGVAARVVERGDADLMIAGGTEAAVTPLGLGAFCAARALSQRNDEPERASRPWDRDRDGFVLADGAGALILEELEHARARGARVYAELLGYAATGDAHHVVRPPEDGEGARRCVELALRDAGVGPEAVGYVNAHATSTRAGDLAEARALRQVFGERARRLPVSSTKSMTGHMLGAAGAVEAALTVLSLRDQLAPPTVNLDHVDPECDLDIVRDAPRPVKLDVALSNSFGFGGTNAALVFGRL